MGAVMQPVLAGVLGLRATPSLTFFVTLCYRECLWNSFGLGPLQTHWAGRHGGSMSSLSMSDLRPVCIPVGFVPVRRCVFRLQCRFIRRRLRFAR